MANPTRMHQLFKHFYEDCDELSVARAPTSRSMAAKGFCWLCAFIDQVWKASRAPNHRGVRTISLSTLKRLHDDLTSSLRLQRIRWLAASASTGSSAIITMNLLHRGELNRSRRCPCRGASAAKDQDGLDAFF